MEIEAIENNGTCWYMLDNKPILVQKLLGEWHYWDGADTKGWHPLSEIIRIQLKPCNLN